MKVSEIKEIMPLAEVCEIKPDVKYLVRVPKGATLEAARAFAESLKQEGLTNCVVMIGDVKFFEIS